MAASDSEPSSGARPDAATAVSSGLARPIGDVFRIPEQLVKLRRDPVDVAILDACLDAAATAVTGRMRCELVVVRDPERLHQLAREYRQTWSLYKRVLRWRGVDLGARQWEADHFEDVPVAIVGCAVGIRPLFPAIGATRFYRAVLPPMQHLVLAARAMGLATSASMLPVWSAWQTRRTLDLPYSVTPVSVVTMGWPVESIAPVATPPGAGRALAVADRHGNQFPGQPLGDRGTS